MKIRCSPDFDAYASGLIPVSAIRCLSCGIAPCACVQCPAVMIRPDYAVAVFGGPAEKVCGMMIAPGGQCARGHSITFDHCPGCAHRYGSGCGCDCCKDK